MLWPLATMCLLSLAAVSDARRFSVPAWLIGLLALAALSIRIEQVLQGNPVTAAVLTYACISFVLVLTGLIAPAGFGPADVAVAATLALALDWVPYLTAMLVACVCGMACHTVARRHLGSEAVRAEIPIPFVVCVFLGHLAVGVPGFLSAIALQ